MNYKLLFDEQLTPELVKLARAAGHVGSTCVRDRGLAGMPDWKLMEFVLEHEFTLVTLNATDFRGRGAAVPGGLYARTELHAGLVCLSSVRPLTLDQQCDAFGAVFE